MTATTVRFRSPVAAAERLGNVPIARQPLQKRAGADGRAICIRPRETSCGIFASMKALRVMLLIGTSACASIAGVPDIEIVEGQCACDYRQLVVDSRPAGYWRLGEMGSNQAADEGGNVTGTYVGVTQGV